MSKLEAGSPSGVSGLLQLIHRYRLALACAVIVLCFAIGNDMYAAKTVMERHKSLLGARRVYDFGTLVRNKAVRDSFRSDLSKRYLVTTKSSKKGLLSVLANGSDRCAGPLTAFPNPQIVSLPYQDLLGTTASNATDNYDLTGDPTGCPAPTCLATSGNFQDRGYTYAGTGTGPDVAYNIKFGVEANLQITLDPTDQGAVTANDPPNGDDLALIFYSATCSNDPANAIVIADNAADGNFPDLPDNSESVTITRIPAGAYNIVVDGYTGAGAANPSAGPFTLNVTCVPSMTCIQPLPILSRRGSG